MSIKSKNRKKTFFQKQSKSKKVVDQDVPMLGNRIHPNSIYSDDYHPVLNPSGKQGNNQSFKSKNYSGNYHPLRDTNANYSTFDVTYGKKKVKGNSAHLNNKKKKKIGPPKPQGSYNNNTEKNFNFKPPVQDIEDEFFDKNNSMDSAPVINKVNNTEKPTNKVENKNFKKKPDFKNVKHNTKTSSASDKHIPNNPFLVEPGNLELGTKEKPDFKKKNQIKIKSDSQNDVSNPFAIDTDFVDDNDNAEYTPFNLSDYISDENDSDSIQDDDDNETIGYLLQKEAEQMGKVADKPVVTSNAIKKDDNDRSDFLIPNEVKTQKTTAVKDQQTIMIEPKDSDDISSQVLKVTDNRKKITVESEDDGKLDFIIDSTPSNQDVEIDPEFPFLIKSTKGKSNETHSDKIDSVEDFSVADSYANVSRPVDPYGKLTSKDSPGTKDKTIEEQKPKRGRKPKSADAPVKAKSTKTPKAKADEGIRINKFIADCGYCSRRAADELIKQGVVKINGAKVTKLGVNVTPADSITINGDPLQDTQKLKYILLNKPKGYITTTNDEKDRKTVIDLVNMHVRIYPVGRLDRNTTGALIMTNDGDLTYHLTHPKFQVERVYNVELDKELPFDIASQISKGLDLDGEQTAPCEVFINPKDKHKIVMTLTEGKNREIRRIFEKFGFEVKKLDRKYYAGISTSGLDRGEYRFLEKEEVRYLKKLTGLL